MGWSMPDEREKFTLDEFVAGVRRSSASPSAGPVFDLEKLTWLNGKYLRRLSPRRAASAACAGTCSPTTTCAQVLPLVPERIDTLEGFFEYASFFFVGEVAYDAEALAGMVPEGPHARPRCRRRSGRSSRSGSIRCSNGTAAALEAALRAFAERPRAGPPRSSS